MSKIQLSIIIFLSVCCGLYAQTKTYNGPYADGTATYTYKQSDDFSRIFDGTFSYKSSDGKKGMSGKYSNNMKVGLWKISWYGFQESVNYNDGLKHGLYKIKYRDEKNELSIDGNFIQGEIDSLNFTMITPLYRLRGTYHQGKSMWLYTSGATIYTQYFNDNTYACDTRYNQSTGEWEDITIEDAKEIMNMVDYIKAHDYTSPDGVYYKAVSEVDSPFFTDLQNNGGAIFSADFKWLNEPAYFFIYKFHEAAFDETLVRGEVCDFYHPLCFYMTEDTARKMEEERRIAKEIEEKKRKEEEYRNRIEQKRQEFNKTEYGQMISILKKWATSSTDEEFEYAKENYIHRVLLSKYRLATAPIRIVYNTNNKYNLTYRYSDGDKDSWGTKFIEQSFDLIIPEKLIGHAVMIVPTEMIIKENKYLITSALIVYIHLDSIPYLKFYYNELTLGAVNNYLSGGVSITKDLIFKGYLTDEQAMIKIDTATKQKYKKEEVYYDIWSISDNSAEEFLESITKEEVLKSIEERFNIKMEQY